MLALLTLLAAPVHANELHLAFASTDHDGFAETLVLPITDREVHEVVGTPHKKLAEEEWTLQVKELTYLDAHDTYDGQLLVCHRWVKNEKKQGDDCFESGFLAGASEADAQDKDVEVQLSKVPMRYALKTWYSGEVPTHSIPEQPQGDPGLGSSLPLGATAEDGPPEPPEAPEPPEPPE